MADSHNTSKEMSSIENGVQRQLKTEFLIVGCGPAGASLACFLASHGLKGIMIGAAGGTANTPRAHITNMAALECLRDIGIDKELDQVSSKGSCMMHTRWCHSMAGEEFARIFSWGNDPKRIGDYETASPCKPADIPQTLLEPVLIKYATHNGFKVRFDTELLHFDGKSEDHNITVTVKDNISGEKYDICTKYLFGADGAQSRVVKQLDLPLTRQPSQGLAINVLVRVDLSHLVESRKGNLHWVMQPEREHPNFGWTGIVRMVKPWNEWMFILFPKNSSECSRQPTDGECLARVEELIGDGSPAEILDVSRWYINETVAERYSKGNIFCLGDAVHRHPPLNGLGSNTCIQDAFNLAWKVAYVHRGLADPSLLSTYNEERQPVGQSITARANQAFRDHSMVWEALGTLPDDLGERQKLYYNLSQPGLDNTQQRQRLRNAIERTANEFHGLGIEMNQHYLGQGIYDRDEQRPYKLSGPAAQNPVQFHQPNTYPGSRLPHVWLNTSIPSTPYSTIDLAGHGKFILLTGIGGQHWKLAANTVSAQLGVPIKAWSIGFRQDWEDFYFDWERVRGVSESGAVLVRPDRFVAWRAQEALDGEAACTGKLGLVMRSILGI